MAIQPLEWLRALDAHCLLNMELTQKRAIILECEGKSHTQIAAIEGVSEATVAYWFRTASSEIGLCLPAGAKVGKVVRGYWVGKHIGDCLAHAIEEWKAAG